MSGDDVRLRDRRRAATSQPMTNLPSYNTNVKESQVLDEFGLPVQVFSIGDDAGVDCEDDEGRPGRKVSISADKYFETLAMADPPKQLSHKDALAEAGHEKTLGLVNDEGQLPQSQEDRWKSMVAVGHHDVYDDEDGHIITHAMNFDDEDASGAANGYTRVNMDEGAQSADSLDESTQYLFTETLDDGAAVTPLSQMQATKDMLTEGQRIAYVGMCRLLLDAMHREIVRQRNKDLRTSAESMHLWSQKMMMRLYTHLDVNSAEQVMIEQLAEHGVRAEDLTPVLITQISVKNPVASSSAASVASEEENEEKESVDLKATVPDEVKLPDQISSKVLDIDLRWTILCDLFLILIADSLYDSRSRVLMERAGEALGVSRIDIIKFERRVTEALEMQESSAQEWDSQDLLNSRKKQDRNKRYLVMGLATIGGGLVIGLSAGILAPVIGAGLGAAFTTVGIAGTGGFLAGAGGAALITTGGVLTGSGIAAKASAKRTRNVSVFEFRPVHNSKRLNLLITVSGWMTGTDDDVRLPFSTIDPIMGDIFSLLWEPDVLSSMGATVNILTTEILTQGLQTALGQTMLATLMAAIQWPIILTKLSYLIDNPWNNSLDRAKAAGLLLADTLMSRNLGLRPINLAGFSLGARVIYYCLLELARCHAYGIVQDVFIFGTPVVFRQRDWAKVSSVVAGRLVNGFKRDDWVLGYLFRATSGGIGRVCGLRPIEIGANVDNLDCTHEVQGHYGYREAMPRLMAKCDYLVTSEEFTEIEDPDPDRQRERQRELLEDIEAAKGMANGPSKNRFRSLFSKKGERARSASAMRYDETTDRTHVLFDAEETRQQLEEHGIKSNQETSLPPTFTLQPTPEVVRSPSPETAPAPAYSSPLRDSSKAWSEDERDDEAITLSFA